jgi:hypothetical protein
MTNRFGKWTLHRISHAPSLPLSHLRPEMCCTPSFRNLPAAIRAACPRSSVTSKCAALSPCAFTHASARSCRRASTSSSSEKAPISTSTSMKKSSSDKEGEEDEEGEGAEATGTGTGTDTDTGKGPPLVKLPPLTGPCAARPMSMSESERPSPGPGARRAFVAVAGAGSARGGALPP